MDGVGRVASGTKTESDAWSQSREQRMEQLPTTAVWVPWQYQCAACEAGPKKGILETDKRIKSFVESFRLNL